MLFSRLAEYFGKIEATSLRNEKTVILAEILREATPEEVAKLVYLALGGLRPAYDRLEFDMGERMILRAIGATDEQYQEGGDLGELVYRTIGKLRESECQIVRYSESSDSLISLFSEYPGCLNNNIGCQSQIEMSAFPQHRNVLF